MRVDPDLTAHTAGVMLDAAADLAALAPSVMSTLELDPSAFGTLPAAAALARAHRDGSGALEARTGEQGAAFEADSERLYEVAFAALATDDRARGRLGAAARRGRMPA
jgi:hypothetical protein